MKRKIYDVAFNDLFKSQKSAVVSYLSLERRYIDLVKRHQKLSEEYDSDTRNVGYAERGSNQALEARPRVHHSE